MKNAGLTVIELLLVISIIGILAASFIPFGLGFLARSNLDDKTKQVVSLLQTAHINSLSGKENSSWGIHIGQNKIILFKGSSYLSPGTPFDQQYDIPTNITISQADIVFNSLTGNPSTPAIITISNNLGKNNTLTINQVGTVDVN